MTIKTIFLDRDGVINHEVSYLHEIESFEFINGVFKACLHFNKLDYKIIIVTNQSGIARGYFKYRDVCKLHKHLQNELIQFGTKVDKIFFCPYHKNGVIKKYKKSSALRKPKIGMFRLAKKIWNIDRKNSFIIGDQITDMQFAKRAKIKGYLFDQKNLYTFLKTKIIKDF